MIFVCWGREGTSLKHDMNTHTQVRNMPTSKAIITRKTRRAGVDEHWVPQRDRETESGCVKVALPGKFSQEVKHRRKNI